MVYLPFYKKVVSAVFVCVAKCISPLIVKLLEGNTGKRVVLAGTKKSSRSVNAFKSLNANIFQGISLKKRMNIRCFVIDNKVVASIQRTMPGNLELHLGGTATVIKATMEESD
jgi:glutathione synthase/RimK-type ligase-like ATP-grasp enzyme